MLFNVWVTTSCNLACAYCYEGNKKRNTYMDLKTADRVFDFIRSRVEKTKNEYVVINYHGGEPLLNFDTIVYLTEKIKKELYNHNVVFGVTTNGLLLNEKKSEYLADNFLYNLSVSVDGLKDTHDMYRKTLSGEGTYDKVMSNISYLLERRKDLRARMTYIPETVQYLYENISHLADVGFRVIVPVPDYSNNNWQDEHSRILEEEIVRLYEKYGNNDTITISLINPDFRVPKGRCNAGEGEINIDCSGKIYPCTCMVHDAGYAFGTVEKPQLSGISELLKESENEMTDCSKCSLSHWCVGARCKLVNKSVTGRYGQPPEFLCAETNAIFNAYRRMNKK